MRPDPVVGLGASALPSGRRVHDGEDVDEASVEGFITDFVDDGDFRVSGQRVDASEATIEYGTREQLQNGVRVKVEGSIVDGVRTARETAPQMVSVSVGVQAPWAVPWGANHSTASLAMRVPSGRKVGNM